MIQNELKSKTKLYAIAAILSAILIVSAIYTVTTPTVMYGTLGISPMKHFNSIDDIRNYLTTNTITHAYGSTDDSTVPSDAENVPSSVSIVPTFSGARSDVAGGGDATSLGVKYSGTNIQVAGVDEADIKTDGKYIYTVSGSNDVYSVKIVDANPKNPRVVSTINFDSYASLSGMYLSENGNKLAVLGNGYHYDKGQILAETDALLYETESSYDVSNFYWLYASQTFLYVYDVSNPANPVLTRNVTLNGNYVNSRMINNYVYLIVSQQAYADDNIVPLPRVSIDASPKAIVPTSIYYTDIQDTSFTYTIFTSINIINDTEQPTNMTILLSASSCMYASTNNLYITFNKYESTELYRVAFNGATLNFKAQGTVPGYVLNQYSMDEYNKYFRIATTVSTGTWNDRIEYNNLYILNMNLDTVGKLEKLAEGERIYSARFAGDKAYLVTFKQVDPFFILDLKNPTAPKVAGELKIPGVSHYLHPYNENYVIGLGREGNAVKLSLFDVTDTNNPTEIAKYLIDNNNGYTDSVAMHEPKAFLFDQQKQLLIIPISTETYLPLNLELQPKPGNDGNSSISDDNATIISNIDLAQSSSFWSGVYVFQVSPENGFTLKNALSFNMPKGNNNNDWNYQVQRSLYINNTLYTISGGMIQLNSLDDFQLIARVIF